MRSTSIRYRFRRFIFTYIYIYSSTIINLCVQYSLLQLDPPGMVIPTSTAQKATEYTATSLVCGRIYKALGEPRGESELSNGCGNSFPWFSMVFWGYLGISGDSEIWRFPKSSSHGCHGIPLNHPF